VLPAELLDCLRTTLLPLQNDVLKSRQFQQEAQNAMAVNLNEQDAWLSTDIKAIKKDLKGIESSLRLNGKRMNALRLKDQGKRLKEHTVTNSTRSKKDPKAEVDQKDLEKINRALKSVFRQAFREL
jgi:hypothetical protein